jgi:hypothetical protein
LARISVQLAIGVRVSTPVVAAEAATQRLCAARIAATVVPAKAGALWRVFLLPRVPAARPVSPWTELPSKDLAIM